MRVLGSIAIAAQENAARGFQEIEQCKYTADPGHESKQRLARF